MKTVRRLIVVLAATVAIGAGAGWLARWYLVKELAERVSKPSATSQRLLPELSRLGPDGLEPLAEAAASPYREVALPARNEVDRLVRRWAQLEDEIRAASNDGLRIRLAEELLARADRFSPVGQAWLSAVAARLLQTSERATGDERLVVLCDELLAAARRRSEAIDRVARTASRGEAALDRSLDPSPVPNGGSLALNSLAEAHSEWQAATPASPSTQPSTPLPVSSPLPVASVEAPLTLGDLLGSNDRSPETPRAAASPTRTVAQPSPAAPTVSNPLRQPGYEVPAKTFDPPRNAQRLPWGLPSEQPVAGHSPAGWPTHPPARPVLTFAAPVSLGVVTLLPDRWLLRHGLAERDPWLRAAILRRGFGAASRGQLAAAVSDREEDRLALADSVLATRGGAAARLLLLLASDASPRVRLKAISGLAHSGNRVLVEAAWRMAVRDSDTRVAQIANTIQRR